MKNRKVIFGILFLISGLVGFKAEAIEPSVMSQEAIAANNKWRAGIKRYFIEISSWELKTIKDKKYIEVKGKSNFPDDARLYVFLKKGSHSLNCKVVRLKGGLFLVDFGPLDANRYEGEYEIEVSLMRFSQNSPRVKAIIGDQGQKVADVRENTIIEFKDNHMEKISTFTHCTLGDETVIAKRKQKAVKYVKDVLMNLEKICDEIYLSCNNIKEQEELSNDSWILKRGVWEASIRQNQKEIENNYEIGALNDYRSIIKNLKLVISNITQLEAVCAQDIGLEDQIVNKYKSTSPEVLVRSIKTDINRINRSLSVMVGSEKEILP
jgi:hypothetical protein